MLADAASPVMPDTLSLLRQATGASHERLDAAFGSVDLATRDGLARFLAAHAIGFAPLFPTFAGFIEGRLGLPCPDYPAMLQADLAALNVDAAALPLLDVTADLEADGAAAGVAYVVCGSRLGLAMIRQKGYWGEAQGFRSAYMTDGRGHEAWKALMPILKGRTYTAVQNGAAREAALAAFATFAHAFTASAGVDPRVDG